MQVGVILTILNNNIANIVLSKKDLRMIRVALNEVLNGIGMYNHLSNLMVGLNKARVSILSKAFKDLQYKRINNDIFLNGKFEGEYLQCAMYIEDIRILKNICLIILPEAELLEEDELSIRSGYEAIEYKTLILKFDGYIV
jgi:hypothetical protein